MPSRPRSTTSSSGATSWRFPIASPAHPRRLTQRVNDENGSRSSSSSASSGGQSTATHGHARRSTSGSRRLHSWSERYASSSASAGTSRVDSSFARITLPYSSARAGNVAACARPASCRNTGHVSTAGGGISVSTTRAPSASSRSDHASTWSLLSVSRPSPSRGARRRSPTVRPASCGSGTARPLRTDHSAAVSSTVAGHRPDGVERRAERIDPVDRDPAPARLQRDDVAGGGGESHRAAGVRSDREVAEARGESRPVAAGRATRRPAGMGGVVDGAVPLVRAEHPPRELRQIRLPDDRGARVQRSLDDDRVSVGHVVRVDLRAVRRADARGVDEVLDEKRASRERPAGRTA